MTVQCEMTSPGLQRELLFMIDYLLFLRMRIFSLNTKTRRHEELWFLINDFQLPSIAFTLSIVHFQLSIQHGRGRLLAIAVMLIGRNGCVGGFQQEIINKKQGMRNLPDMEIANVQYWISNFQLYYWRKGKVLLLRHEELWFLINDFQLPSIAFHCQLSIFNCQL